MVSLLLSVQLVSGQESPLTESKLKAAFLFNFTKYVEWPPSTFAAANAPITIGIFGDNPFGSDLEAIIRGRSIAGRSIVIRAIHSLDEATNCQALFISASEKTQMAKIFSSLGTTSILTVGDLDGFAETGGMVEFIKEGSKIRFLINKGAVSRAGLKISSKLLNLASRIIR